MNTIWKFKHREALAFLIVSLMYKATVSLTKFNYPKECISIHNLPREILEQLKERQLTELLMYISKREGLIYSSLKGMSPGNNFQGDSPVSESEHLKDTFSDFLV